MSYIIVANSPYRNFDDYVYNKEDIFIGMEDGCIDIINRGFDLDYAIGDFDHTANLDIIKEKAKYIQTFNPDKNEIDLELVLMFLSSLKTKDDIYIYNAAYGRTDHELITIKLLMKYHNLKLKLVTDKEYVIYLTNEIIIKKDHYFSLIPYSLAEVSIIGARYNLDHIKLNLADNYTSSNYAEEDSRIIIHRGGVIVVMEK